MTSVVPVRQAEARSARPVPSVATARRLPARAPAPDAADRGLPTVAGPGLPAAAAVALAVGLAIVGAGADRLFGHSPGAGFAVLYVIGVLLAALGVRRDRLAVPIVAAPLIYAGLALATALVRDTVHTPVRLVMEVFTSLIVGAPALAGATALALAVAALRRPRRR